MTASSDVVRPQRETLFTAFQALYWWSITALRVVGGVGERLPVTVARHRIEIKGQPAPIPCNRSALGAEDIPIVDSDIRAE